MANSVTSASMVARSVWTAGLQWPLQEANVFDSYAAPSSTTERGERGKEVIFRYINDLATAPKPIDEYVGPEAKTISWTTDSARMTEHGNTVEYTALAKYTATDLPVQETLTTALGRNAGQTLDEVALAGLLNTAGGVNFNSTNGPGLQFAGGKTAENLITKTDTLTTTELEIAATEMRVNNVPTFGNGMYKLFATPYQIHDLRLSVGPLGWREPRENGSAGIEELRNHEVGSWAGFDIVSSNKLPVTVSGAGSGASQAKVTRAIAIGSDGFVKVYSDHPEGPGSTAEIIVAPPVDEMQRIFRISWYALLGYKVMRPAGVRHILTGTSRG